MLRNGATHRWGKEILPIDGLKLTGLAALMAACTSPSEETLSPANDAAPTESGWTIVWQDEFEGRALDGTKWRAEESCWGGGNNERQCYTARTDNVLVADGMLRLKARKEEFTGPLSPEERRDVAPGERTQSYTSGKVRTLGLADWKYGRFSARMKLPKGQGTWPAFWMMPSDDVYGKWPLSGEIDIMEAVNLGTACEECVQEVETRTSGAIHFGALPPENTYWTHKADEATGAGPGDEWRVYSVEWGEGVIQWFVDDQLFMRATADDWYTAAENAETETAPFDQNFYLMLNLAVGGRLPENENGMGFDPASFPNELKVDWVRVEQCAEDITTGRACMSDAPWQGELKGPSANY